MKVIDNLPPPDTNDDVSNQNDQNSYHFFNFPHLHWISQDLSLLFFLTFPSENKPNTNYMICNF